MGSKNDAIPAEPISLTFWREYRLDRILHAIIVYGLLIGLIWCSSFRFFGWLRRR